MVFGDSIIPYPVRSYLILITKKCRKYAACGVSQTPIYHTGNEDVKFTLEGKIKEGKIINKTIDVEKKLSIITDMTIGATTVIAIESVFSVLLSSISQLIKPKKHEE